MEGDAQVADGHPDGETEGFQCFLVFKDDKEPCVRKEDIDQKGKTEVDAHKYRDTRKIVLSEYSQEKEVESDDREEFEKGEGIGELENRKKVHKSAGNPVPEPSSRTREFKILFLFLGDEGYEASFCNRGQEDIEDDSDRQSSNDLPKIGSMYRFYNEGKKLILEVKNIDIRKGELV